MKTRVSLTIEDNRSKDKTHVNEWSDLSEAAIEGIKAGIADSDAGRVLSHADVMAHIDKKMKSFVDSRS